MIPPFRSDQRSALLTLALLAASTSAAAQEAPPVATTPPGDPPSAPVTSSTPMASPPAMMPPPVFPPGAASEKSFAAPPPSSGLAWLIVGGLATAGGVGNLTTAPICELHSIRASARTPCLATSLAFGGGLLALGIPLLVVGAGKRSAWMEWTKHSTVGAVGLPGGGAATWMTAF